MTIPAAIETLRLRLGPPVRFHRALREDEIADIAATLPCPMPASLRELLRATSGFERVVVPGWTNGLDHVDFSGRRIGTGLPDLFPHGRGVAADGCGNLWVADLRPDSNEFGPIYFACHDPPVVLLQSPNIEHFVEEMIRLATPPHQGLLKEVWADRLFDVWRKEPGLIAQRDAVLSADPGISAFARTLEPEYRIADLRDAPVGMGFAWHGHEWPRRRFGLEPIFAVGGPGKRLGLGARFIATLKRRAGGKQTAQRGIVVEVLASKVPDGAPWLPQDFGTSSAACSIHRCI